MRTYYEGTTRGETGGSGKAVGEYKDVKCTRVGETGGPGSMWENTRLLSAPQWEKQGAIVCKLSRTKGNYY